MFIDKDYCENNSDKSFNDALSSLSSEHSFSIFDYHFDNDDLECLDNLAINLTAEYNNYGNLENLDQEAKNFVISLGNDINKAECVSIIIKDFVQNILIAAKKDSAWVALRASTPNSLFDTPRWHMDGKYYSFDSHELQYKVVISLKGASTLFYPLGLEEREEFNVIISRNLNLANNEDRTTDMEKFYKISEENRITLADKLDLRKAIIPAIKQAVIFVVGSDFATAHSEPSIKEPRLFLSILPGTKEQIEELKIRWQA